MGLGNFFRAHQAWYTDRAPDAAEWGIAAFTGRSATMAQALEPQDGLYTLITRAADGDSFDVISSVSTVHAASDHAAWLSYWRDDNVALVTLTITEAGYLRAEDGHLDMTREDVQSDVAALRADSKAAVSTAPGRIVAGYLARRDAGAGSLAVLPCDNLPHNGPALRMVLTDLIDAVDPSLADWAEQHVAFGTTMVDRITPATTDEHRALVLAATGRVDSAPVPTEPFSEWVIQGEFPHGRPAWDAVGARVVADVEPFEQRKLWLLNGSHSLLAYAGPILGHETVADAISDPVLRTWVEQWWDEACRHLSLSDSEVADYRVALIDRYQNPAIRHVLAQIAVDGSQKLPVRILPTLRAERAAGRVPLASARVLAAWVCHLRGLGAPVRDAGAAQLVGKATGSLDDAVDVTIAFLDKELTGDAVVRDAVLAQARDIDSRFRTAG
jgi:fructuronate reductase